MGDKVFVNGRAAVHATSGGKSVAFPDVCLCPPTPPSGPVPTPLPNTVVARDLTGGATSVLIESNPAGHVKSYFALSSGNEVSRTTGGGVLTKAVQGRAHFRSHAMNVFFDGEPAVRHLDLLTHNHLAQPGNTPPAVWMSTMKMSAMAPSSSVKAVTSDGSQEAGWARVFLQDKAGFPLKGVRYHVRTSDGRECEGRSLQDGIVHLKRLPSGTFELTLPDYDAAGWQGAETGPVEAEPTVRRARQGDTFPRLAWKAGFTAWRAIYDHPDYAELKEQRPNPEILVPGDEVVFPRRQAPRYRLATNRDHRLTADRPSCVLRLVVEDDAGVALRNARFELTLDDHPSAAPLRGQTDSAAVLEQVLPMDAWFVTLQVWPASPSPDAGPYQWSLFLGALDPIDEISGVQARLENLGFSCGGDEHGVLGEGTLEAVRRFRAAHGIQDDELLGTPTREHLAREYGC